MTTINPEDDVITLINTFEVNPDRQQELVKLLVDATTDVMRHLDGFVSANLHQSLDGKHVANYAQWKSKAHFDAMLTNPKAHEHMRLAAEMANRFTPVLFRAIYSDSAASH